MSLNSASLIVVSNRLPFTVAKSDGKLSRTAAAGGLVTAVAPVVIQSEGLWVGWPGPNLKPGDRIPESDPKDSSPTAGLKSGQVVPVSLDSKDHELYYNGCCNATLWPLFHSMPDRAVFDKEYWISYTQVNDKFANATIQALRQFPRNGSVPLVWIHDYHLMLAATKIRKVAEEENLPCKLAFFLHIPFPPWDMIKIFPWHDLLLQGVLNCDLIGFHIPDYCDNFLSSCQRGTGARVDLDNGIVEHMGRRIRVKSMPISIPYDRFEQLAMAAADSDWGNLKVILGVDRLDYTKGLVSRFKAFERFLSENPEFHGKVMLLQVAVPSRTDVQEYQDLKEDIDQLVGQINGRFSTAAWAPIRYIYGAVPQSTLAGYYRDADVALLTPLRDGMNLVAKEFVACRTNESSPGVLILSPFAGAGGIMREALLVNPYELSEVAKVIRRALLMPEDERLVRMTALRSREKVQNVDYWMNTFMRTVDSLIAEEGCGLQKTVVQPDKLEDFEKCLGSYVGSTGALALLLDYDGTLSPIAPHPDQAIIPPETKEALERLSKHPDVFVAIISGRAVSNVKSMVGIEEITYAGSHGLDILYSDGTKFAHPMPVKVEDRVKALASRLENECGNNGAWVENKGAVLTYHYRNVEDGLRPAMVSRAKELIFEAGFRAGSAHCAIESKPPVSWDKGRAAIYILKNKYGVDWTDKVKVIYAGDDVTDEDAMTVLKGLGATFRVTASDSTPTIADKRVRDTNSVLTLLHWVEKHMTNRGKDNSPMQYQKASS